MPVERINIEIDQGGLFNPIFTWRKPDGDPIDISGYTATMQIRESRDKNSDLIWSGTSGDGDINLFGLSGQFRPIITADETGEFSFAWAYYDLKLIPIGDSPYGKLVMGGNVKLNKTVIA